jgi:SET domain-containing protein
MNYVLSLNSITQNTLLRYCYKEKEYYKLNADNMRFFNHSIDPNTRQEENSDWAIKDIQIGEEITCNYFSFDEDAEKKLNLFDKYF